MCSLSLHWVTHRTSICFAAEGDGKLRGKRAAACTNCIVAANCHIMAASWLPAAVAHAATSATPASCFCIHCCQSAPCHQPLPHDLPAEEGHAAAGLPGELHDCAWGWRLKRKPADCSWHCCLPPCQTPWLAQPYDAAPLHTSCCHVAAELHWLHLGWLQGWPWKTADCSPYCLQHHDEPDMLSLLHKSDKWHVRYN